MFGIFSTLQSLKVRIVCISQPHKNINDSFVVLLESLIFALKLN